MLSNLCVALTAAAIALVVLLLFFDSVNFYSGLLGVDSASDPFGSVFCCSLKM